MDALERLRDKLSNSFGDQRLNSSTWGQPQLMTNALSEVNKAFDSPTSELPERSIAKVMSGYRSSGSLQSFLDLKYACFGIGQGLTDDWCLFDDDKLFFKLLDQVKELRSEPRRFRKCYQGLLSSYFSYAIFTSDSTINWEHLREYLVDHLQDAQLATPVASWATLLEEHRNLLGPKPCDRYVQAIREGYNGKVHKTLQEGLGIQRESWVWQELVLSQVEVACNHDEQGYKNDLARLLNMLQTNSILSPNLVTRCVAKLVCRYVQCSSKPEHDALRDSAVSHIGNPWLKRTAWDAHVKTCDGQPNEAAREMVNGWIKRWLIKDFFELLSDDGSADPRRLNYWLRFEPVIEPMWFALGPHARKHPSPDFKEFRYRARGRLLTLEKPGPTQNNAFIMRLGTVTVVEFGSKGNATYMYRSDQLPFDLGKSWINGDGTGLKKGSERFFHRDSQNTGTTWEEKLDALLCPLIDFRPSQDKVIRRRATISASQAETTIRRPTSPTPQSLSTWEREVKALAERYSLAIEDNRHSGGNFWILIDGPKCPQLSQLGFRYKPGKGWWKK